MASTPQVAELASDPGPEAGRRRDRDGPPLGVEPDQHDRPRIHVHGRVATNGADLGPGLRRGVHPVSGCPGRGRVQGIDVDLRGSSRNSSRNSRASRTNFSAPPHPRSHGDPGRHHLPADPGDGRSRHEHRCGPGPVRKGRRNSWHPPRCPPLLRARSRSRTRCSVSWSASSSVWVSRSSESAWTTERPARTTWKRELGAPVIAVVPKVEGWTQEEDDASGRTRRAHERGRRGLPHGEGQPRVPGRDARHQDHRRDQRGPGRGKSATTANLAVTLAQTGKRVVAMSCDLRKPRLHSVLRRARTSRGSRSSWWDWASLGQVALRSEPRSLRVIASGTIPPNPAELLGSEAMASLLRDLREVADYIVWTRHRCWRYPTP